MSSLPILLGEAELVRVLIESGLITRKDFVDGDVRLAMADRRNRNVKVSLGKTGLFTKQAKTPEAVATLKREALFLDLLSSQEDDLSRHLPRKLWFDPNLSLLVSELIPHGMSLHDMVHRNSSLARTHAGTIGVVLAGLHDRDLPQERAPFAKPPHSVQWNRPHVSILRNVSPANIRLLEAVQNERRLSDGLDALQNSWQATSIVHGDVKMDNLVVVPDGLVLVDWEIASLGDPRWDVGSVFANLLSTWVASMPMAYGASHDLMVREAWFSINDVQVASTLFWDSYTQARRKQLPTDFLSGSLAYCSARLVQTAYEYMQYANRLTANVIYTIQIAANLISNPAWAANLVLGRQ